ncbi:MAG: hypothetical protein HKN34_08480 [Gammaproteobacteria bacterium]|nr:hypothetical protein [Gammaproteobacteria bacterium]
MSTRTFTLTAFFLLLCHPLLIQAELQDQGLNSIMQIIDKAIDNAADAGALK